MCGRAWGYAAGLGVEARGRGWSKVKGCARARAVAREGQGPGLTGARAKAGARGQGPRVGVVRPAKGWGAEARRTMSAEWKEASGSSARSTSMVMMAVHVDRSLSRWRKSEKRRSSRRVLERLFGGPWMRAKLCVTRLTHAPPVRRMAIALRRESKRPGQG